MTHPSTPPSRASFVFPGIAGVPVGGYKVAFLHAEALAASGWEIDLILPVRLSRPTRLLERLLAYSIARIKTVGMAVPWFPFSRANPILVPWIDPRWIPDLNRESVPLVAVGHAAASCLVASGYGRHTVQFIQGFEDWSHDPIEIRRTWHGCRSLIGISQWIVSMVREEDLECAQAPNGIELDIFRPKVDPSDRKGCTIGFLAHPQPLKDSKSAVACCAAVREQYPDTRFRSFGPHERPDFVPDWIEYMQSPRGESLADFYNSVDVFLATSLSEGWGLVPSEAMACGCAVVATDIGGHREFCVQGSTALMVAPGDVAAMTESVSRLLSDRTLRMDLGKNGAAHAKRFSWSASHEMFANHLRSISG